MLGALEDLYRTRTSNDTKGTIAAEWDRVLLWRDLDRLIEQGFVEASDRQPEAKSDFRQHKYFKDLTTGEVYVYVEGWERGSPEFRKYS